jgi:hypothetical protein
MSKNVVRTILIKNGSEIISDDNNEIKVESSIELETFPPSINVTKTYLFLDDKLGGVAIFYKHKLASSLKKVLTQLHSMLEFKYGKPQEDTTVIDKKSILGVSIWKFNNANIHIKYLEIPKSSSLYKDDDLRSLQFISIVYNTNNYAAEMIKRKKYKRENEF